MVNKINSPSLLSALWTFILFNIIFRDLHEFLNQGYVEELMALNISAGTKIFYGLVLEIPILMTLLSRILSNTFNKWINMIVASMLLLGTLTTLAKADMDDVLFTVMNSLAFSAILYIAWKLPSKKNSNSYKII